MFKNFRMLNKNTNEEEFVEVDLSRLQNNQTEELLKEYLVYNYLNPDEYVQIPDNDKIYTFIEGEIVENTELTTIKNQLKINEESRKFLSDTDWKVIRHNDQLALGVQTSLTPEVFILLLQERQQSRERVMEV